MITAAEIQMIRNADPGAVLPGIDTPTGNPYATSTLLDVTKITQNSKAPYFYKPSENDVYVTQAGAVLSGINFGTATVILDASNVTIEDCTFTGTTGYYAIDQAGSNSGATIENCTFTGSKSPTEYNTWIDSFQGSMTIENNTFLNSPGDAIDMHGGVVTGNYFSGAGYLPGAHADAIWVPTSTGTTITNNFIDGTVSADSPAGENSDLRLTNEFGDNSNVTVSGNFLLGGNWTVEAGTTNSTYTISNMTIADNYIGFPQTGDFYPSLTSAETVTGNTVVDFTNPTPSIAAQAAYVAPTPNTVSATTSSISANASGSTPATVFGNGIAGEDLGAGSGETNFVGGASGQHIFGGLGANILTYLAMSDGGDLVSSFDPAKDIIDLSHIDADPTTPGVQNFTFIGQAAFDGAAGEVRYVLNPTKGVTYVQAALAGDTSADFTITLGGLFLLTAANFALTPAQSSADLAGGAALTYSRVQTAAGAPTEYAYTNVEGRSYASYESFNGSGYLWADDLNLSATSNELILYQPNITITRAAGSESLLVGTGTDPLSYDHIETIDATTSGDEHFVFGAGFGAETINGFAASGASPDTIQLATSSFSYLTAGMSQAQDLAAVLAHASNGPSGLTIGDSNGDSLTLLKVSIATIAANPAAIQFA
jgi:hypothetical protein